MAIRKTPIIEALNNRRSIRAYMDIDVSRVILEKVLAAALRTPSCKNIQPWELTVVTGEVLGNIRRQNVEKISQGISPNPDVCTELPSGNFKQRSIDVAMQLYQALGINHNDRQSRASWMEFNSWYFDAPAVIFVSSDRSLNIEQSQFSIGAITQSICLAALDFDLGTCIEYQGILYPDIIRKYTGIPDTSRIAVSIALGYPDWDAPVNQFVSQREHPENIIDWRGFD